MIDDDLPTNNYYLNESFGAAAGFMELSDDELLDESTDDGEMSESILDSHQSVQSASQHSTHMSESIVLATASEEDSRGRSGETIRMLVHEDIEIIEDFFETIEPDPLLSTDIK